MGLGMSSSCAGGRGGTVLLLTCAAKSDTELWQCELDLPQFRKIEKRFLNSSRFILSTIYVGNENEAQYLFMFLISI